MNLFALPNLKCSRNCGEQRPAYDAVEVMPHELLMQNHYYACQISTTGQ